VIRLLNLVERRLRRGLGLQRLLAVRQHLLPGLADLIHVEIEAVDQLPLLGRAAVGLRLPAIGLVGTLHARRTRGPRYDALLLIEARDAVVREPAGVVGHIAAH
jgi:hypothetical protein